MKWIESVAADIRYALRALRHSPAFTIIVVLTLALGIGANTAIFSVIRGVLLRPLPHRDGDRLVYLRHSMEGTGGENIHFSVPAVPDLRTGVPSFAGVAEYSSFSLIYENDAGDAERLATGLVTGNYFEVMGLSPVLGRLTRPSDDGPGVPPVVVLTHQYWMKRFGGDSSIVGKRMTLDKRSVEVIGVLQPAPFFPNRIDVLANMVNSEHHLGASMVEGRSHRMTEVVARLKPGSTLEQTRTQVGIVRGRLEREFTDAYPAGTHHRFAVIPFHQVLGERAQLTLWLLMGAAAFVLVISAANVANLTLMRGVRREHELAVRAALGAGGGRLRRLLVVENLLLAIVGGALGVEIAVGGVGLLTSLAERYSPRASEIRLDGVVLGFTLTLSVAVALLLSFLASLPREGRVASWILAGGQRISGTLAKQRLQRGLVVVQVAVTVVLLAGAGLLTRTMLRLSEVDTGLVTDEVLTLQVNNMLTRAESRDSVRVAAARARLTSMREELAALPGVVDVAIGTAPLRNTDLVRDVRAEGRPLGVGEAAPRAELRVADADYFRAAGIPVLAGRSFSTTDRGGSFSAQRGPAVVIINRRLADRLFPGADAVGKRIAWTDGTQPVFGDWTTVIGVVGNTQDGGMDAEPRGVVFLYSQLFGGGFVIRADRNVAAQTAPATRIVRRIAPTALIEDAMTVPQYKDQSISPQRLNAVLIASFGILAMIIAGVGIAGVLAFSVSARTIEIGQKLLFGVPPHDPTTFIGVAVLMAAIGIVACWIPAVRAARIDPAITMRSS